ncbi:MAG TPA: TonB-dependent receptor plug domain-containing protein [Allosphingosinicella sp.]|nr:TonB-dependent receptor plug domain-containing protein [Allosphingosinicella sp.]
MLWAAAPSFAQEGKTGDAPPPVAPPPATVEGPRTFTPQDFARFAPQNALDMLRQVPGFSIREQSQERGLGQATANVLINGQRMSGKSDEVTAQLSRIPAQNVVRIEIVDGATLDIPGLSGQVANVIAKAKAKSVTGQFSWSPEFRAHSAPPLWSRFDTSASGERGAVEWTVGLDNQTGRGGASGPTWIYGPDGTTLIEYRDEVMSGRGERPRISTRFAIDGPGSSVGNLNLSLRKNYGSFRESGSRTGPGLVDRERLVRSRDRGHSYEIGGDYDFALGPGRLKLIGLNRENYQPTQTNVVTSFADLSPDTGNRFIRSGDLDERIGRAEYRWKSGGADWQISAEGAFNSLDNVSQFFVLLPNGDFQEIPLPGGTAQISEDRYEMMGSYGRPLAGNLSVQLSAGGEYSKLSHIAGETTTGEYWRPKGQLSAAWKPHPRTDVNVKLQRRVGQLNFYDFLAVVNLSDERRNAGNPDLVPPQSWELDVETIRNLGRWGTTTLRLYGHLIDDIVDIVPIGETGESPGNIDRAMRYGTEWKSTFNFDPLGWRGAKLDSRLLIQGSRVKDPLTGEHRPISNSTKQIAELSLRHDVPDTDWAWGSGASYFKPEKNYRLTEVSRFWEGPVWLNLFLEHKNVLGLTVRGTVGNILGGDSMADRTVYVKRRTGPIAFFEKRDRHIGPIFSFSVRGKF